MLSYIILVQLRNLGVGEAMDLYQILRVSATATHQEIQQAYQRLIKECRYNAQLNRKDIELAYRVLANPLQKAQYDAKLELLTKTDTIRTKRIKKIKSPTKLVHLTLTQKTIFAVALFIVALLFYVFRYGYLLKSFSEGDVLYNKSTNKRVGKIIKIEEDHNFGLTRSDAYLIENAQGVEQWVPQDIIKSYCQEPQ